MKKEERETREKRVDDIPKLKTIFRMMCWMHSFKASSMPKVVNRYLATISENRDLQGNTGLGPLGLAEDDSSTVNFASTQSIDLTMLWEGCTSYYVFTSMLHALFPCSQMVHALPCSSMLLYFLPKWSMLFLPWTKLGLTYYTVGCGITIYHPLLYLPLKVFFASKSRRKPLAVGYIHPPLPACPSRLLLISELLLYHHHLAYCSL
jgi:hypothetical protein